MTLQGGQTARCSNLNKGELYVALVYNSSQHDQTAALNVVWTNKKPPVTVRVPGSTGDAALATMLFVSGKDTNFFSLSLGAFSTASVDIVLVSVSMPANTTGITDRELSADGNVYPFPKLTRYHAIPPQGWSSISLASSTNQFISIQMAKHRARVIVLNKSVTGLQAGQVQTFGPTASKDAVVQPVFVCQQHYTNNEIKGTGQSLVWMCADSAPNAQNAKIALQSLSTARALISITSAYATSLVTSSTCTQTDPPPITRNP